MGKQWMKWVVASLVSASLFAVSTAQATVQLQVRDRETGRTLTQHSDGARQWIAGEPGHRYAIDLYNASHQRVLVVLSVDGVNAISGQTAATNQGGYVLDPWERITIDGWRKSLHNVAAFEFTRLPDSYAARTGRPGNVGVIGMAVFAERQPLRWSEAPRHRPKLQAPAGPADDASAELDKRAGSSRAPGAYEPETLAENRAARQYLGTGHGEQSWSPARQTQFERASHQPQQVTELYYDHAERLVALGVLPPPRPPVGCPDPRPQAFPGFVPDPPPLQRPRHPASCWPRG